VGGEVCRRRRRRIDPSGLAAVINLCQIAPAGSRLSQASDSVGRKFSQAYFDQLFSAPDFSKLVEINGYLVGSGMKNWPRISRIAGLDAWIRDHENDCDRWLWHLITEHRSTIEVFCGQIPTQ
jgi:hypothetical protein